MCYIHRGRTTLMRCSLLTAGYIPVSRTHHVYIHSADRRGATWGRRQSSKEDNMRACTSHRGYSPVSCIHYVLHAVQREDSMWACTSHRGYIHVSCIHHVLHAVQREDNMRAFPSHSRLHSALSYSPCTIYTVQTEGGQHEGAHFTQN